MINFTKRLESLKNRRQGSAERDRLEKGLYSLSGDYRAPEDYEKLHENAAVKYVIGAMAQVSADSTRISREEGERVASTLMSMLSTVGIDTEMKMQGSVALDIHIEGYSDVDMLILKRDIFTVQGPELPGTSYVDADDTRPMPDIIRELRLESEKKLTSRYHRADVNVTGNKSISLSGGSLKRKVDVVPACWYDTHDYQRSRLEHFRAVRIYDKSNHSLIQNQPFLHIRRVNDRDFRYTGNLKKVARLMKNVIADMPDYKKSKAKILSSFDIAGIAYAMDEDLRCSQYLPLTLLENLRSFLLILACFEDKRFSLLVPDESRQIFNIPDKTEALKILCGEISDLADSVQKAINPSHSTYNGELLRNKQVVFF